MIFRSRSAAESDAGLIFRAAKGDEHAFRELLKRHQGAVYRFALRFLNDSQEAEDVAQEVFLRLYRAVDNYQPRASLRAYLFKITKNLCIDSLRKKRPESMAEPPETIDNKNAFEQLSNAESMQRLSDAVSCLPDNQRAAIILRHDHGMSYQEIAESLGVTGAAVESLLSRARRTLREQLYDLL